MEAAGSSRFSRVRGVKAMPWSCPFTKNLRLRPHHLLFTVCLEAAEEEEEQEEEEEEALAAAEGSPEGGARGGSAQ
jgi:hypothetical protein